MEGGSEGKGGRERGQGEGEREGWREDPLPPFTTHGPRPAKTTAKYCMHVPITIKSTANVLNYTVKTIYKTF